MNELIDFFQTQTSGGHFQNLTWVVVEIEIESRLVLGLTIEVEVGVCRVVKRAMVIVMMTMMI